MATPAKTTRPTVTSLSCDFETTAITTPPIPAIATHGSAGRTLSTALLAITRSSRPRPTGMRTVWTSDHIIPAPSTSAVFPASHSMSRGVIIGETRVDTEVIATDSATSPLAR